MMGKIDKIILILTLSMCNLSAYESSTYVRHINEILRSVIPEIEKRYSISCCGSGGSMPYDIEEIELHFIACRKTAIDDARKLEVEITDMLIDVINKNEKIRPYLRDYPFNNKRIDVMISFRDKKGDDFSSGVTLVFHARDKIFYHSINSQNENIEDLFEEPYEEAWKIIHSSKD